jgi:hypothetical protein
MSTEAKWIRFEEIAPPSTKTKRWAVMPKDGSERIGSVSWYAPWRKYCFFPRPETVYEQDCLRDLARFCEAETTKHRMPATVKSGVVGGA